MIDVLYYALAVVSLPGGALLAVWLVSRQAERDLERSRIERETKARTAKLSPSPKGA